MYHNKQKHWTSNAIKDNVFIIYIISYFLSSTHIIIFIKAKDIMLWLDVGTKKCKWCFDKIRITLRLVFILIIYVRKGTIKLLFLVFELKNRYTPIATSLRFPTKMHLYLIHHVCILTLICQKMWQVYST